MLHGENCKALKVCGKTKKAKNLNIKPFSIFCHFRASIKFNICVYIPKSLAYLFMIWYSCCFTMKNDMLANWRVPNRCILLAGSGIRKQVECYSVSITPSVNGHHKAFTICACGFYSPGNSSSVQDFIVHESSMVEFATGLQPLLWVSYWLVYVAIQVLQLSFLCTFLPPDVQCPCVAQRTVEVVLVLVVRKVLQAKPNVFNRSNSIMFMFFSKGVLVFTKLCGTQNNYGAQRQKKKGRCWQFILTHHRQRCKNLT